MRLISCFLAVIFLLAGYTVGAQFQAPNYDGISRVIRDKASPYFYQDLFSRFENNDSTLGVQHYRILYYGYIFQTEYDPYGLPVQFDTLNQILNKAKLTKADYQEIIALEKRVLEKFPFNLREISLLAEAYEQTGQIQLAKATHDKFTKIAKAIFSTGDGKTKETAMHVTYNSHEYDILNYLGLEYNNESTQIEGTFELLSLKPNDFNLEAIFFNIQKMFEHEARMLNNK